MNLFLKKIEKNYKFTKKNYETSNKSKYWEESIKKKKDCLNLQI
mgnify:CR=1 FL=1